MEDYKTPHGKVALEFATALANGKFEDAYQLLSSSICGNWSPSVLQDTYEEMIEYSSTPTNYIQVEAVMTDWPGKQPQDIGWAYTLIACDGETEAVTVIVCTENEKHLIRDIEWGRP
ncbi:hypothetical protein [Halotia branconii]|uniref:Uncharacterized protein n=1 Tax=Halotia branconii CENA392 TaxID=1539056 RepID=A0AAJ6PB21_9CYAN|nr:hypothetical protein [Halotia branconii]WGV27479.1 hypothetical protein QI031_08325 [Halotia branconii CENA392]